MAAVKKRKRMPIVGAVMTSFPYFVEGDETATNMERMMEAHGIRHLPVQENGSVVGIVSERDLHHHVKRDAPAAEKDKILARHIMVPDPYIDATSRSAFTAPPSRYRRRPRESASSSSA